MQKKGKNTTDFSNNEEVFQSLKEEFDMSYWAFSGLANHPLKNYNNTFIYQLKGCNIFCPWCYVDDLNKNSLEGNSARFFSTSEIMDVFEKERKKQPLYNFRPSGGEPTLGVEQWLESLKELQKRGLEKEVYIQADTNLTTGHFINHLEETGQIEKNLFKKISEFNNFGVLCSFKGTDTESFLRAIGFIKKNKEVNKNYAFLEKERLYSFGKMVEAGIDAYPFIYDPNPKTMKSFLKKGARMFGEGFILKTWVFPLKLYGPEKERFKKIGLDPEKEQKRLDENFQRSEEIMQKIISNNYGVNYGAVPRPGIKLRIQKNLDTI